MIGNIHVVTPELPPCVGGVADYAARLSAHWPEGKLSEWWVAAGAVEAARANPQWTVKTVPDDVSAKRWPEAGTLFVHYTQYGYAGGGIPWGLVLSLKKWRRAKGGRVQSTHCGRRTEDGGRRMVDGRRRDGEPATVDCSLYGSPEARRLVVFFHETWLDGPLWRRRGFVAPFARWCAHELARSADVVVTNCERHVAQLADVCDVTMLPVPANIIPKGGQSAKGEGRGAEDGGRLTVDSGRRTEDGGRRDGEPATVDRLPCLASSKLRLVIFGLPETRLRTLKAHRFFISWLHNRGGLGELVLLGAGDEAYRFAVAGARLAAELAGGAVRRVGSADAAGVSAELVRADLGLSAYAADEVGKSGTLAALFSHGCAVGCVGHNAGGLALDLSSGACGAPCDWNKWQDADACAKREALVAAYVAQALNWDAHAARLAALVR